MFEADIPFSAYSFDLCFPRVQKSIKKKGLFSVHVSWKHYGKENINSSGFGMKPEEFHQIIQLIVFADNVCCP